MENHSTDTQREFAFSRGDFEFLSSIINQRAGIVVTDDKFNMFYSRLSRRLRLLNLKSFAQYCEIIRQDESGEETVELINAITTNLTAFFRENHHFEYFRDVVLPQHREQNPDGPFRIWSAGCSTGEEPYSLAMVIAETYPTQLSSQVSLMATDLDSNVLATGSRGVYALSRVSGIEDKRLKQWFLRGKGRQHGQVRVKPELSRMISFSQLNLMENWQVEKQDVIFCRNVIIYFDKATKKRLVNKFADALKPGGYLFVGHSESLYKITDRFELIGNTVYRKVR